MNVAVHIPSSGAEGDERTEADSLATAADGDGGAGGGVLAIADAGGVWSQRTR